MDQEIQKHKSILIPIILTIIATAPITGGVTYFFLQNYSIVSRVDTRDAIISEIKEDLPQKVNPIQVEIKNPLAAEKTTSAPAVAAEQTVAANKESVQDDNVLEEESEELPVATFDVDDLDFERVRAEEVFLTLEIPTEWNLTKKELMARVVTGKDEKSQDAIDSSPWRNNRIADENDPVPKQHGRIIFESPELDTDTQDKTQIKKYNTGAKLITSIRIDMDGELTGLVPAGKILKHKKINFTATAGEKFKHLDREMEVDYYVMEEKYTTNARTIVVPIIMDGVWEINMKFIYNPETYPQGEELFKKILDSIEILGA